MRLFEGAIGPTRLAQATATACLDSQQRLAFDCHLEPAQARQTGHVKLSGSLPLTFTNQPSAVVTHSFTRACIRLFVCPSIHPVVHSCICSFLLSFLYLFVCLFLFSIVCSFILSFVCPRMHCTYPRRIRYDCFGSQPTNNVLMFPTSMNENRNGDGQSQSCCLLISHSISAASAPLSCI